ncbi:MAG: hypothetical protein WBC65_14725 [Ignavibacteria bacterium]|jgi:hypothetical protein
MSGKLNGFMQRWRGEFAETAGGTAGSLIFELYADSGYKAAAL